MQPFEYILFKGPSKPPGDYRIPAYRCQLVKEGSIKAERKFVECSADALSVFRGLVEFQNADREKFAVLYLDTKHRVIWADVPFSGSINTASVYPREIVKAALLCNAAAMILCHNHPSGDPEPSAEDRRVTQDLKTACQLFGISVLDHLILGEDWTGQNQHRHFSFADKGMM